LGGKVGNGRQGMSWIHELDLNRLFQRGLTDDQMRGTYIASAPYPVPQVEFMQELRRALGVPIGLPASSWMVRMGARLLLRTDPELALYGRYVVSQRLANEGFRFQLPNLRQALQYVLSRPLESVISPDAS
jgi:NAD dependent epimerase/dehydratase family enzyme